MQTSELISPEVFYLFLPRLKEHNSAFRHRQTAWSEAKPGGNADGHDFSSYRETVDVSGGSGGFELGIGKPLAYNKWIRMQVEVWPDLPRLYRALPPLISVRNIESSELMDKASDLNNLLDQ